VKFFAALLVLLASPALRAAEVLSVGPAEDTALVTQETQSKFLPDQLICISGEGKTVQCGKVTRASDKEIQIKFTKKNAYQAGEVIKLMKARRKLAVKKEVEERKPAATTTHTFREKEDKRSTVIGLGIGAGTTYFFPVAIFTFPVSDRFSLGVIPIFVRDFDADITAFGGFLTGS